MPIVSSDKFQYFQPQAQVGNIQGRMIVPSVPSVPSEPMVAGARFQLRIGEEIEKLGKAIHTAQVKDDVQRLTLGAMDELSRAEVEISREGSHRDMPARFEERLGEIRERYQTQTAVDREVASAFNEKFGILAQNHLERVRLQSWRRELDQQQAGAIESGSAALNLIGKSQNMREVQLHMKDYLDSIEFKARTGLIDASWAAGQKELFKGRVGGMLVEQDILVSPELAIQRLTQQDLKSIYPGLSEEKRVDYLRIAGEQFTQRQNEAIAAQNRKERVEERAKKDAQEKAYGDALISFSKGELSETMVQGLLSRREIDPDKGASLLSSLRSDGRREENDPVVLGDLVASLELGRDITEPLTSARTRGQVKTETFIALRKEQANEQFRRGLNLINGLKPSESDKWSPDKHIRYTEAVDEYSSRVASGQEPIEVGREILGRYMGDVRRTARGILRPRYLDGDKLDPGALEEAKEKTAQAFQAGKIDASEFAREAERLQLLTELAQRARADAEELTSEELKAREKKVRKQGKK